MAQYNLDRVKSRKQLCNERAILRNVTLLSARSTAAALSQLEHMQCTPWREMSAIVTILPQAACLRGRQPDSGLRHRSAGIAPPACGNVCTEAPPCTGWHDAMSLRAAEKQSGAFHGHCDSVLVDEACKLDAHIQCVNFCIPRRRFSLRLGANLAMCL